MILVFGENRRQKPIELRCPAGRIRIARARTGVVEVEFVAEAGRIEVVPESKGNFATTVRLVQEQ